MTTEITLPLWFFALLLIGFIHASVFAGLLPSLRWYIRKRSSRKADKKNSELQIKIRPFLRTPRRVVVDRVCNDTQVIEALEQKIAGDSGKRSQAETKVQTYATEIVPYFNALMYFNFGYWLAKSILRFLYRIKISAADASRLDQIDPNATVVFVMNHRSNIDYLLVAYLVANKVTLSYAVGEWARVFPLEQLVKSLGAFFVRRKSNDPLYRKVLERYVHMATTEGVCQAIYLEGGLSRDGNFQPIKMGFLDYMLRGFDANKNRDIVFVPIAINYDRVLEDKNMLKWAYPEARLSKTRHFLNFVNFMKDNMYIGSRLRWRKFGYASVNFGIPVSIKNYQMENQFSFSELDSKQRFVAVKELAGQLMTSVKYVMPVLPVPLISCVFMKEEQALRSLDIFVKVEQMIQEMINNGAAMKKNEQPRNKTLMESLKLLVDRKILEEKNDYYKVAPEHKPLIAYYANSLQHLLTNEKKI